MSIDLERDEDSHERLTSIQGDIADAKTLEDLFGSRKIDTVFHCAAMLAHEIKDKSVLWRSNVNGTAVISDMCQKYGVTKVVYLSSNCLWAKNFNRPVTEDDTPEPVEIYGRSKWEGEKILQSFSESFHSIIFRCPTIVDAGRVGLLGILFEFIREGRRVWVVGDGGNRYRFIYAGDLVTACIKALNHQKPNVFNVGSDNVVSLREIYEYVIARAGTSARVARLPKKPTLLLMRWFHSLGLSPLGSYHYKMIGEDFVFDTSKIKKVLAWSPTLTNQQMLHKAYEFYVKHPEIVRDGKNLSAYRRSAGMGIIRLLKMLS